MGKVIKIFRKLILVKELKKIGDKCEKVTVCCFTVI